MIRNLYGTTKPNTPNEIKLSKKLTRLDSNALTHSERGEEEGEEKIMKKLRIYNNLFRKILIKWRLINNQ